MELHYPALSSILWKYVNISIITMHRNKPNITYFPLSDYRIDNVGDYL